ncbi:MAG: DNA starvation/stationary phase protection protein [Flavobacteriales bacterium]|nr:DNA starvation/stationary phase protection protein [Flavobacteriales bacterium]
MKNTNTQSIGLKPERATELALKLNELLANYSVHYQNLRGFHWNIKGTGFFELHAKFEDMYLIANEAIDEIAERILTLEHTPLHSYADYLERSEVTVAKELVTSRDTVGATIQGLQTLLSHERVILELSGKVGDEGTNALMSDYIRAQEKLCWMLKAYLS